MSDVATRPPVVMDSAEYQAMFDSEDSLWWYRGLRDAVTRRLHRLVPRGSRVLDAGCGTGRNLQMLEEMGYRAEGVDLSEEAIAFCRRRRSFVLALGSVLALPFADGAFDAVLCMDVLAMLPEEEQRTALREMRRVVRPGGALLLHAAALPWLRSVHDLLANAPHRLTKRRLRRLLVETGWETAELGYRVFLLLPAVAAVKTWKRWRHRPGQPLESDQGVTPGWLNAPLSAVQVLENRAVGSRGAPIGSSLLAVARRPVACDR